MPTPLKYKAEFNPRGFYHVVFKAVDGILIFNENNDYPVFKQKVDSFLADFFDFWSYCFLSNHTHFIIKTKSEADILKKLLLLKTEEQTVSMKKFITASEVPGIFSEMIERQVNRFLVSYSVYYNAKYDRKGGLFQKNFRRVQIFEDSHLQQAIIYCNANPEKHKIISDFKKYLFSSYRELIESNNDFVDTEAVINFFGSKEKFVELHKNQVEYYYKTQWPSSKIE